MLISLSFPFKVRLPGEVSEISLVIKAHSQKETGVSSVGEEGRGFCSKTFRIHEGPPDVKMGHEPR